MTAHQLKSQQCPAVLFQCFWQNAFDHGVLHNALIKMAKCRVYILQQPFCKKASRIAVQRDPKVNSCKITPLLSWMILITHTHAHMLIVQSDYLREKNGEGWQNVERQ